MVLRTDSQTDADFIVHDPHRRMLFHRLRNHKNNMSKPAPRFRVRYKEAFSKQIGVRPGSFQEQGIFVSSIGQEPDRFDMAFHALVPIPER